jgi:predicted HTH domain antitoxin
MNLKKIEMTVTEQMLPYINVHDESVMLRQRALLLYPYIYSQIISHGRAAEILGISKWDLITLYGKMGIPYIDYDEDEIDEDIRNSMAVCAKKAELSV